MPYLETLECKYNENVKRTNEGPDRMHGRGGRIRRREQYDMYTDGRESEENGQIKSMDNRQQSNFGGNIVESDTTIEGKGEVKCCKKCNS